MACDMPDVPPSATRAKQKATTLEIRSSILGSNKIHHKSVNEPRQASDGMDEDQKHESFRVVCVGFCDPSHHGHEWLSDTIRARDIRAIVPEIYANLVNEGRRVTGHPLPASEQTMLPQASRAQP